jgi:hypothetical protein
MKLLAYLLLVGTIKADQPVHCLGGVTGTWNFHVSSEIQNVNLYTTNEVCTHQMPNKLQLLPKEFKFKFEKEEPIKVHLNEDMSASIAGASAKWFSFYDQAFKVEADDGTRYLANYRYSLKEYESTVAGGMKSLS